MEHAQVLQENEKKSAKPVESSPGLVIHDVLNGTVTFEEYHSSKNG